MAVEWTNIIEYVAVEECETLIESNTLKMNKHLMDGRTPLTLAICHHRADIVRLLVTRGATVDLPDAFSHDECELKPVHYAAAENMLDTLQLLIEHGACAEDVDQGNSTPLHHAAANGNIDILNHLVRIGCDVNSASRSGKTALWKAVRNNQDTAIFYLLNQGADFHVINKVGQTMAYECAENNRLDLLSMFLHKGLSITTRDIEGSTLLHYLAANDKEDACEVVLKHVIGSVSEPLTGRRSMKIHAAVCARNDFGNTPLHNAALMGHGTIVLQLLNWGACASVLNYNNASPVSIAISKQNQILSQNIIRLFYNLGYGNCMKSYINETTDSRREALKGMILKIEPRTLKLLSLVAIRGTLTVPCLQVHHLPLPRRLKHDLLNNASYLK